MKILVYDDNPDFGGHQVMAARGIEALVETDGLEITLMHHPDNRKFIKALKHLEKLQTLPAAPKPFQAIQPDTVLCIQGDIAQSTAGITAAKKINAECVSYLAVPHPLALMGAKLGAVRDARNRPLFNKPDRFITISDSMKQLMQDRGCRRPIAVVPNGIPAPPIPKLTTHDRKFTIGLIGRIEFNQKQQDFFVRTFLSQPAVFSNCRLLIVGSGPDEQKLKKLIKGRNDIALLPWQENMEEIYEQLDIVVIPSRYEGVPLVMLEAIARGIPVIGSRRDGMKDILPEKCTFETENARSMARAFLEVRASWRSIFQGFPDKIQSEHSLDRFNENFIRAVTGK